MAYYLDRLGSSSSPLRSGFRFRAPRATARRVPASRHSRLTAQHHILNFCPCKDERGPKAVGHLDADCFYVSAERVRDEFLRGKPVGVLGNQGACVIAKSYEMKAAGVATGMPIWDALVKCPDGRLRQARLPMVRGLEPVDARGGARALAAGRVLLDRRVFLPGAAGGRARRSRNWRRRSATGSWERVGVPVTVGIARTRTLAKLISDSAKPFGALAVLDRAAEEALLADRPVTEITGIAGRRAARLLPWGITTCLDLARADRRLVRSLLTASGEGSGGSSTAIPCSRSSTGGRPTRRSRAAAASASRPPTRSSSTPGWCATSSG